MKDCHQRRKENHCGVPRVTRQHSNISLPSFHSSAYTLNVSRVQYWPFPTFFLSFFLYLLFCSLAGS